MQIINQPLLASAAERLDIDPSLLARAVLSSSCIEREEPFRQLYEWLPRVAVAEWRWLSPDARLMAYLVAIWHTLYRDNQPKGPK